MELDVVITGRIPASSSRIIDLSPEAYEALELEDDTVVMIIFTPPQAARPASAISEMSRLNTPHPVYHLLILDRIRCAPNAGLEDTDNVSMLYTFQHAEHGYLIALYVSFRNGTVFPQMPENSRIILDMVTVRKETIIEYIQSSLFRTFVGDPKITADLLRVIRGF